MATHNLERYSRQMILSEVGEAGQEKLRAARIAVVGMGGLGGPSATYLAAAGVGQLTLIDNDLVDLSNLHRQVIYRECDIGESKVTASARRLRELNSEVQIDALQLRLDRSNAVATIGGYDLVLDCSDNFSTRYTINDVCAAYQIPLVQASIFQFEAQLSIFCADGGPCLRCLYPEPPPLELAPSCAEAGVLGTLPGIMGAMQANEALKFLLGAGEQLNGKLASLDVLKNRFNVLTLERDPDCPACSKPGQVYGSHSPSLYELEVDTMKPRQLEGLLSNGTVLQLLDVRDAIERSADGNISPDIHTPLPELEARLSELDRSLPTIVYCATGIRSQAAAQILKNARFVDLANLKDGMQGWNLYRRPVR